MDMTEINKFQKNPILRVMIQPLLEEIHILEYAWAKKNNLSCIILLKTKI